MELLSQYIFDIDSGSTTDDLTCIRCRKLLNDAYQAYCGCQYCHKCIVEYLSEGERLCCGCKLGCNDEPLVLDVNVHKNAMLNRRVLRARVICPNKSCMYSDELVQMKEHLRICTKQSIECPYSALGCDTEKVTKGTMLTHLANETLPHTQLLIDLIQNLRNEVGASTNKTEIAELRTSIERIKEECAEKENRIASLEQESRDKDLSAKLQHRSDTIRLFILFGITFLVFGFILTNRISAIDVKSNYKIVTLENESKKKDDRISALEVESKKTNTTIDGINIRTNTIGVTTFTVDIFDARRTAEKVIHSPYFYSHLNGYKLRLRIDSGGNGDGKGTHLSVFIQICKGEYDDILVWPCKYTFEVALINRSTGGIHHTRTLSYDTASDNLKCAFNKPINKDNEAYGYHKFVSVADLRSVVGLIVDDSVTIRSTVHPRS